MKRVIRSKAPILVAAAAAAVSAALVVSPAIGGPSIKKLVRNEVAKQIAKATGPQGLQGSQGIQGSGGPGGATGATGAAGAAVAYAHVDNLGGVVEADSKGITDANVSKVASPNNAYCFNGLPFNPKNIQVTQHFADTAGTIARHTAMVEPDSAACPGTEQATVQFYVTSDVFTSATTASGFYVVFE